MSSSPHLSSARQLSLALVLMLVAMLEITTSHLTRISKLDEARADYAAYLASRVSPADREQEEFKRRVLECKPPENLYVYFDSALENVLQGRSGPKCTVSLTSHPLVVDERTVNLRLRGWFPKSEQGSDAATSTPVAIEKPAGDLSSTGERGKDPPQLEIERIIVQASGERDWRASLYPRKLEGRHTLDGFMDSWNRVSPELWSPDESRRLRKTAFDLGLGGSPAPDTEEPKKTYDQIERLVLRTQVSVPNLQSSGVGSTTALWLLTASLVILLIVIASRLRSVLGDPDRAKGEPWLIADGRQGFERYLAMAWLILMLASPWLSAGMLAATVASQIEADGIAPRAVFSVVQALGIVGLLAVGSWTAARVVAMSVEIRRSR